MRILLLAALLIPALPAQVTHYQIRFVSADPSGSCAPSYITVNKTTGNVMGCIGGTWASIGGGGSGTPGGSPTAVQYNDAGAFGGDVGHFQYYASLSTPSAPTVTVHGTPGTSSYGYKIVFRTATGTGIASAETTIATGNETLDTSNYNTIPAPVCTIPGVTVDVYRTTSDPDFYTNGFLKNIPCSGSVNDDGTLNPNNETPPAADTSRGVFLNASNLVTTGHGAFGSLGSIDYTRSAISSVRSSLAAVEQYTQTGVSSGILGDISIDPSDNDSSILGIEIAARSLSTNSHNQNVTGALIAPTFASTGGGSLTGMQLNPQNTGIGHLNSLYGIYSTTNNGDPGGVADTVWGYFTALSNFGSVGHYYGLYVGPLGNFNGGTTSTAYGVWIGDQSTAANGYALWYDGPGNVVWRVKADGVMADYNPAFSPRYTPGATEFERMVMQWNSNVAEIGTEKGSTGAGVLRPLRLLGAGFANNSMATADLPACTATTGTPWRASVNDATAPTLGDALTGGGSVFANVHCSLTTGTYLVDGL